MISKVKNINGVNRLFINDEMIEGDSYITYYTDKNNYKQFSDIGFNIFSIPIYFSTRSINELSDCPPLGLGIFDNKEGFALLDKEINRLLDINSNALIFLRVDTTLPKKWDDNHPDELNYEHTGNYSPRPCFASDIYLAAVKEHLTILIDYIKKQRYHDHIFGYQLSGGRTQEWFACDIKGSYGLRTEQKYQQYLKDNNLIDSYALKEQFKNDQIGKFITELAHHVKKETNNELIVGAFYGYITAVPYSDFGHLGINQVLNCKDIDFLCAPMGYYTNRSIGVDYPLMVPLGSFNLHNKLFFSENDARTDLTKAGNALPAYNTPIWFGPNRKESLEICKMHYATSLCRNHTYWWFDMWGGWYDDPEYLNLFKKLKDISHEALKESPKSIAKVALLLDTLSMCGTSDYGLLNHTCRDIIPILSNKGIQYDIYLVEDYEKIKEQYEVILLSSPTLTSRIKFIKNDFNKCYLITENTDLNELSTKLNNYRSFNEDLLVYENSKYLYLMSNRPLTLDKPKGNNFIPLLSQETFPLEVKPHTSYLFKK